MADRNAQAKQLQKWLAKRPVDLAQSITIRVALRSLPYLHFAPKTWLTRYAFFALRPLLISWSAQSYPKLEWSNVAAMSIDGYDLEEAALETRKNESPVDYVVLAAVNAAQSLRILFNPPIEVIAVDAVGMADGAVEEAKKRDFKLVLTPEDVWSQVMIDQKWLTDNEKKRSIARVFSRYSIWLGSPPAELERLWHRLSSRLIMIDPNYSVWIDWYERRIRGERAAFEIPGDKGRIEDKKILRRLAEATNQDFWGKGHEYVNATLKGWLDEARERVAPAIISAEAYGVFDISGSAKAELGPIPLPVQNTNALSFRTDDEGHITIAAQALASQLRADEGARDRHQEATGEARHALGRCQGNNAAARLTGLLTNYLEAAGESIETAKPSLLVQRGERLRQELARYETFDHMLPPVADDLLLDLKGWQSAHNMMVGLDPVLVGMDTAILGPDRQPSLIPPYEIRAKSEAADEAGILADEVVQVLIEAADLAPDIPDPNNRLTVSSNEMMRNLIIEAFSVALNHPVRTGTAVVASALLSSGVVAGVVGSVSIMGSIKAAEYLVNHREWILNRLGNTPTWQALITKLVDWLEEVTPFEPK
jgi:hypothetical protein